MIPTSGSQSRTTREASSENAAMPTPSHRKMRSCFVGMPHRTINAMVPSAHAAGAPTRKSLRRSTRRNIRVIDMAATAEDHGLLIGGHRVETGGWTDVRSPFSGDVVGRVARGGGREA